MDKFRLLVAMPCLRALAKYDIFSVWCLNLGGAQTPAYTVDWIRFRLLFAMHSCFRSAHYYLCLSLRSGTCTFSEDHCKFFLLNGYNLVLRARAAFLMYPCGSGMFKCVCNLVGLIFSVWLFPFLVDLFIYFRIWVSFVWWWGRGACFCLRSGLMFLFFLFLFSFSHCCM